jgi:hypothetical protein
MQNLGMIINATDAKLIIISSWRRNTLEDTKLYLAGGNRHAKDHPFPYIDKIIGQTDRWYAFKDMDPKTHKLVDRGFLVKKYLEELRLYEYLESYLILDDNNEYFLEQGKHYIQTDPLNGLQLHQVDRAIAILNNNFRNDTDWILTSKQLPSLGVLCLCQGYSGYNPYYFIGYKDEYGDFIQQNSIIKYHKDQVSAWKPILL